MIIFMQKMYICKLKVINMKRVYSLVALLLVTVLGYCQSDIHSTPEKLVNAMFEAVKTRDNCVLRDLADPKGKMDGDALAICSLLYQKESFQEEVVHALSSAKINGYVTYETVDGVSHASVPILMFGEKKEQINLVNRRGLWFLESL